MSTTFADFYSPLHNEMKIHVHILNLLRTNTFIRCKYLFDFNVENVVYCIENIVLIALGMLYIEIIVLLVHYCYISALVFTCFHLTKGRATSFRLETIVSSFLQLMVLLIKVKFINVVTKLM